MKALDHCRLYAFIDEAYREDRSYEDLAKALCDGGADIIQLRMKGASKDAVLSAATKIFPITESAKVHLIINDHLEVARQMPNPFVHLGQEDFFDQGWTHVDQMNPGGKASSIKLGLSTHAPDQADRAIRAGADYVAIGPVFATPTKPEASPVTLDYVCWASQHIDTPWFSIGGINASNVDHVLEAGATRICVVSAILKDPDPQRACAWFRKKVDAV